MRKIRSVSSEMRDLTSGVHEAGYSYLDKLSQLEEDLYAQGHYPRKDTPFYSMAQFKMPREEARLRAQQSLRMIAASKYLKER